MYEDKSLTWGDMSNFTWKEASYFTWGEITLGKLELLKKKYDENEPLPPQTYEKLKSMCDGNNKLPPDITRIIEQGFLSIGNIEYICHMVRQAMYCASIINQLGDTFNNILPK